MASPTADRAHTTRTPAELTATLGGIKRMLMFGGILAVIGYLLLVFALTQEFSTVSSAFAEDSMKMWLKLGGVGHILMGIFITLVAIVRALSIMPDRLDALLG